MSAGDRWVGVVDRRGRALVDASEWDQFKTETELGGCQFLADLANSLSGVRALTMHTVEDAAAQLLGDGQPVVRRLAEQCAVHVIDMHLGGAVGLVPALRALGIFSCVVNGRPPMKCPCYRDWWEAEGKAAMKSALSAAVPDAG